MVYRHGNFPWAWRALELDKRPTCGFNSCDKVWIVLDSLTKYEESQKRFYKESKAWPTNLCSGAPSQDICKIFIHGNQLISANYQPDAKKVWLTVSEKTKDGGRCSVSWRRTSGSTESSMIFFESTWVENKCQAPWMIFWELVPLFTLLASCIAVADTFELSNLSTS